MGHVKVSRVELVEHVLPAFEAEKPRDEKRETKFELTMTRSSA